MAYEHFYQYYDKLMNDVPYHRYIDLISNRAKRNEMILDLGCGTGSVLIPLIEAGYQVDGVDVNDAMLLIAKNKCEDKKLQVKLFQDDMRTIQIKNTYQIIYSFLDTINYLTTLEDCKKTFKNIYGALKSEGYFIFDVHSHTTLKQNYHNLSHHEMHEYFTYLWDSYVEEENIKQILYHDLVFFIKQQNGLYQRLEEYHTQVVFSLDDYKKILEEVGFEIETVLYDFETFKTMNETNKFIIIAKKCLT